MHLCLVAEDGNTINRRFGGGGRVAHRCLGIGNAPVRKTRQRYLTYESVEGIIHYQRSGSQGNGDTSVLWVIERGVLWGAEVLNPFLQSQTNQAIQQKHVQGR